METKKIFVLFVSHNSGGHGLTIHKNIDEVKLELVSVLEAIKEGNGEDDGDTIAEESFNNDMQVVNSIEGDGFWGEFSDSTWFDVFEREV